MKKLILVLALIISTSVHTQINKANESVMVSLDQDIAESVLRFHVLANSDTQEDQDLKMKVKNVVADQVAKDMRAAGIESKKDAVQYITTNEDEYIDIAEEVIKENGYDYPVSTTLGKTWFPVKVYGNYIFPEGEYDAFRILIGNAEGKN